MANSVKVKTPILTADELAQRLGISGKRKEMIFRLADQAVEQYYAKKNGKTSSRKTPPARSPKAA